MRPHVLLLGAAGFIAVGTFRLSDPLLRGIAEEFGATEIAPRARGTALSGFVFCLFLGQEAGVFALGYLVDGPGYRAAFAAVAAAVALLTGWMQYAVFDRSRDTSPRT